LSDTFATEKEIRAEKKCRINVEVREPFSIIYVGFATFKHDINVKLIKMCQFGVDDIKEEEKIYFDKRVNCEMNAMKIIFIVETPGIYSVVFDNSYSWFNSKRIRYRVFVLEPEVAHEELLELLEIEVEQPKSVFFHKFERE
jgi:hypothetical protein